MGFNDRLSFGQARGEQNKREYSSHIRTMLKNTSFCILLLVVAASGCYGCYAKDDACDGCYGVPGSMEVYSSRSYLISGRHSSGFQHPAKALFDVVREGHKCVTWELLLKHTAPEETWPISRDELHALFNDIDSDNDTCVTWKEVDSYGGWTA